VYNPAVLRYNGTIIKEVIMNSIEVSGSTKSNRQLAFDAAAWYIKKFMPRMRTLEINIDLVKLNEGIYGYCMEGDTNREFSLEINKTLSVEDLVGTVIHEMIHVKQYARKELFQGYDGRTRWKSRWYSSYDSVDYDDQPWEKEAHRLDVKLAEEFLAQR
jgi:hypothetical protein